MREDACGHGARGNLCLLRTNQRLVCLAAGASASSAEQTVRPQSTAERPAVGPVSRPGFSSDMAEWPAHRVCTHGRSLAGSAGLPLLDPDNDLATGWAEKRTPAPTNPHT